MEIVLFEKISELKRTKIELEKSLNIKISLVGKEAIIEGEPINEYDARQILEAMSLGFSAKTALLLKEEGMEFRKISIKSFTKRRDMKEVRSRIIGTHGKTKNTIQEISGCSLVINEKQNAVGIICPADSMEMAMTAVTNVIRGTKQANVYRYLERINRQKRENPVL